MTQASEAGAPAHSLGPVKSLLALLVVIVGVAVYLVVGGVLGMEALYGGFLFALYWMGIKHSQMSEFWPTVVGALGGVGMAFLLKILPAEGGTIGIVAVAIILLLAIYSLIIGWLPVLVNSSFMLFLTVAMIPEVHTIPLMQEMALSVIYAAVLLGGVVWLGTRLSKARSVDPAPSAA